MCGQHAQSLRHPPNIPSLECQQDKAQQEIVGAQGVHHAQTDVHRPQHVEQVGLLGRDAGGRTFLELDSAHAQPQQAPGHRQEGEPRTARQVQPVLVQHLTYDLEPAHDMASAQELLGRQVVQAQRQFRPTQRGGLLERLCCQQRQPVAGLAVTQRVQKFASRPIIRLQRRRGLV